MKKLLIFLLLLLFSPPSFSANYPIQQSVNTLSGSASVQDAMVIPSSFVGGFTWVSVQLTGTWTGTVTWEVSNDNTNWSPVSLIIPSSVGGGMLSTATTNGTYHGPKGSFLYFRARLSTAGSGTVNGLASFSPNASAIQAKGDTTGQCTGTVTSFNVSGGTTGLTFTGGPITSSGTITATGSAMTVGDTVNGATPNSVLFADASGKLGSGSPYDNIYSKTVILNDAQIKALPTTPFELLPAPGAGFFYEFRLATLLLDASAGAYTSINAASWLHIAYNSANDVSYATPHGFMADGAFKQVSFLDLYSDTSNGEGNYFLLSQVENQALTLMAFNGAVGNFTGGHADNSLLLTIMYTLRRTA